MRGTLVISLATTDAFLLFQIVDRLLEWPSSASKRQEH